MQKSISAFIAAAFITGLLIGVMFLIGQDAFGTSTAKAEAAAASTTLPVGVYWLVIVRLQQRGRDTSNLHSGNLSLQD